MDKQQLAAPKATSRWTRADDYLVAMARLRSSRRQCAETPRTQPESPRFGLSMLPFLALMAGFALLTVAIAIAAWPARDRPQASSAAEARQPGTASADWFERAKREMR